MLAMCEVFLNILFGTAPPPLPPEEEEAVASCLCAIAPWGPRNSKRKNQERASDVREDLVWARHAWGPWERGLGQDAVLGKTDLGG